MKPTDARRAIQLLPFERYRLAELNDTKNNPLSKYKKVAGKPNKQSLTRRHLVSGSPDHLHSASSSVKKNT